MFEIPPLPVYEDGEEFYNMITHGIGAVFAFSGLIVLMVQGYKSKDKYRFIGNTIFGLSMLAMYVSSTFYHGVAPNKLKQILRFGDHISIYLLIAGSYTPIALTILRPTNGYLMLLIFWTVAFIGITFKLLFFEGFETVSLIFFIAMGWISLINIRTLYNKMHIHGFMLMVFGGLAYSIGCFFYASQKKFYHAIWHIFVILGSAFHYFCVLLYL